ncbi:outer membrane beta-barrel protein [Winogradskyella forsetii]|uniref:outer membrane beta-barrel protein n=1 Tax=Winogradskyella forsetii TaxID=2686077 RepID=UPI0015BB4368|nr:outer membrane beta-barrel protein [Winogradskyella forsetii]
MKVKLVTAFFILFSILSFSQINYEKGYYIDEANEKINCLIKNVDWVNNPDAINIKYSDEDKPKTLSIDNIKEFEIYDKHRYIRKEVNLDISGINLSNMSSTRNPILEVRTIFLKVILSGELSLYEYRNAEILRFFYSLNDVKEFEPLIYKSYKLNNGSIGENESFKQELLFNLKCNDLSNKEFENLRYKRESLIKLFKKYSSCRSLEYKEFSKDSKKYDFFNLKIKPGISFASMDFKGSGVEEVIDLENKTTLRIGVETEFIFKFNNNKWAIIVEPTYSKYESMYVLPDIINNSTVVNENQRILEVEYQYLEIPIGLRYYFFINKNFDVFINGLFVLGFGLDSKTDFVFGIDVPVTLDHGRTTNLAYGLGFKLFDKYSAELRLQTSREIFGKRFTGSYFGESNFKSLSIIFGYTLF